MKNLITNSRYTKASQKPPYPLVYKDEDTQINTSLDSC